MTTFADLPKLPEAARLKVIAETAKTQLVGVALEEDWAKIQRYVDGVTAADAGVRHIDTKPGLVAKTVLVRFGPVVVN